MAQIDASSLGFNFSAFEAASVAHFASGGSDGYYWWDTNNTGTYYTITAFSFAEDVSLSPLSGTINAINILDTSYAPGLSITGFSAPLTSLIDTGNASLNHEKFWETLLAGSTTILMPTNQERYLAIMGDFVSVSTGETLSGWADTFVGAGAGAGGSSYIVGDAATVAAGGTLTGGADTFTDTLVYRMIGDVGHSDAVTSIGGTVNGGADVFNLTDRSYQPQGYVDMLVGDVHLSAAGSRVNGGDDKITVRDLAYISSVYGDGAQMGGQSFGGDDVMLFETTSDTRYIQQVYTVAGDDFTVLAGGYAEGGNDTITFTNAAGYNTSGDFIYANGEAKGGDDTIVARGTFSISNPSLPNDITPNIGTIVGDANGVTGGPFTGGNDRFTLTNVDDGQVGGDVLQQAGAGALTGGNDIVTILFQRNHEDVVYAVYGDAWLAGSADFTGGDDTINVNIAAANGGGATLYGDVANFNIASPSSTIRNGDDVIVFTGNAYQSATIYGDGDNVTSSGGVTHTDGDDTLTGGAGADILHGDTVSYSLAGVSSTAGGDDILDGRGGDDILFGYTGVDTAVFSLAQSVYVDLKGIPNTGFNSFEAIGQGSDQLQSIENIIGSSLGDTILGDDGANVLQGMGGGDLINGRGGEDTLMGGDGDDTLMGGAGNDLLHGAAGKDIMDGGAGVDTADYSTKTQAVVVTLNGATNATVKVNGVDEDTIRNIENLLGGSASDTLTGDALANILRGNNGNDTLNGGDGNDLLEGGAGNDILNGGLGLDVLDGGAGARDVADYRDRSTTVTVVLKGAANGTASTGGAPETLRNIEDVWGGSGNDVFTGDALANNLRGYDGNDTLNGGDGNDLLEGGAGDDILNGGLGIDVLDGGAGAHDVADYRDRTTAMTVVLNGASNGTASSGGAPETVRNIEDVWGGSGNDVFTGDSFANTLRGYNGNDTLNGGLGNDVLTGDAGADNFLFKTTLGAANVDRITDFNTVDTIQLENAIFTAFATQGVTITAAEFRAAAGATTATTASQHIIYNTTTGDLYYDADGVGGAAAVKFAVLTGAPTLTTADFVIV